MSTLDYLVLFAYFIVLVFIGVKASRKQTDIEQYFVNSKQSNTLTVMTLWMASWVGGATILGTAEQAHASGMVALVYPLSVATGCIIFAFTFSGRIKETSDLYGHLTYPDFIETMYGKSSCVITAITSIIANIGYTSSQLLAIAILLSEVAHLPYEISFLVSTIITISYTAFGGYIALDATSRIQALLIFLGIVCIALPLTLSNIGDLSRLSTELPADFFTFGDLGFWAVLGMFLSSLMTFYTSGDSYIRCYSAKSNAASFWGTLLSAPLILGIGVGVTIIGLGAKILLPDLEKSSDAFLEVVLVLFPDGVKGLMIVALLSAIMSTASACVLAASANFAHDIYQRFVNPDSSKKKLVTISMISSCFVGIISAFVAWSVQDIIGLLFIAFTVNSACLFVPTIAAYLWKKGTQQAAFYSITLSLITILIWFFGKGLFPEVSIFTDVVALWPGLAVSVISFFGITLLTKKA